MESEQLFDDKHISEIVKDLEWFDTLCDANKLQPFVRSTGVYKIHTDDLNTVKIESTNHDQIRYVSDGQIDYGLFPGVDLNAGIMRFHKGAVKPILTNEHNLVMEVLEGTFEIWQGKKSMTLTPGLIVMQPGASCRIKYTGSKVGAISVNFYDNEQKMTIHPTWATS